MAVVSPQVYHHQKHISKVALYSGSGAVLAEDVGIAFEELNMSFEEIKESDINRGELRNFEVLIVPGGSTEVIWESLEGKGFDQIRKFVEDGGKYIGICAGAYLAPEIVKLRFDKTRVGLGIIDVENERVSGIGLKEIKISNTSYPIARGYSGKLEIWYQNGPFMKPGDGVGVISKYDEYFASIVCAAYGRGKVVLFSPHPEGSLEFKMNPQKLGTLKLLRNAIDW
jgi:glutamine amidotransferase-like uncharacterized protein